MPTLMDEMKVRRSIRKYTKQPIDTESIRNILEAATFAPSAHNAQPWRFVVLTETSLKKALAELMALMWLKEMALDNVPKNTRLTTAKASIERFASAPALIVACLTLEDMDKYPDKERQQNERDLGVQSLAAAIQNLLLSAHAYGLGACWYCAPMFTKNVVRKALNIPDYVEPQALITLGYPNETPKGKKIRPVEECVYMHKWGNPLDPKA